VKAAERHRLKHDKYEDAVVTGFQWSRRHVTAVIAGVVVLLGIAAGILWYIYSRQQAQAAADAQLWKVQSSASMALMEKDAAREDAIRKVRADYDAILSSPSNAAVAPLAAYWAASFLSEAGKPSDAAGYFERARDLAGARTGLRTLAQRGLAESLEAAGKFQEAVQEYNTLAADSQKAEARQETAEADWDIGRCYKQLGSIEQAKVFYAKAQELGGDSSWGNLARFGLESLSHPDQPQPKPAATAPAKPPTATSAAAPVPSPTAPAPKKSDEKAVTEQKAAATPPQAGEAKPIPPEAQKPAGQ
jgi:tetratricopeptide (TPR) repeat protein